MSGLNSIKHGLEDAEHRLLIELRGARRRKREGHTQATAAAQNLTYGQRIADGVAAMMGSWPFIIVQSIILLIWIVLNLTAYVRNWDPYPFILLNLALSFQAAYAAPFIMMSQNRQSDIDRLAAKNDYDINIKAELEIELLHQKLDLIREQEILRLTEEVRALTDLLKQTEANHGRPGAG